MKLVFLPEAENDIERLFNFLMAQGQPLAAQRAVLAIDEGIQLLLETPYIGVQMENRPDYRQLVVPFGKSAYVLRYRIHEAAETIVVIRIWHGREARA